MLHLFAGLDLHTGLLLLLALAFVLFYEAINGFHDTANAVATVIYTRAMRSQLAVAMAALFNFFGVLLGGLSVAYAIVHMLPTDLLLNMGSAHGLAMVFSMLLAAIIWNLGTWYFGLPASSSHTLIGAIIGIGLTNALMTGTSVVDALNIPKVIGIFASLIISPIVGLVIAGGLIFILRRYWSGTKKRARIHLTPAEREKKDGKKKPPFWTRIALILSAIGVSFSHGANDGQKGIGLVMLVLIGVGFSLGNYLGGKFADRSVSGTLKGFLLLLMAIMLAIPLLAQSQAGAAISMIVWGAATFAVVPPLQMRVMRVAHEAPGLSSSVNIGAFNLGNALGAAAGGAVISGGLGYAFVPVMGAIIAGLALLLVWFSGRAQPEEAFASQ